MSRSSSPSTPPDPFSTDPAASFDAPTVWNALPTPPSDPPTGKRRWWQPDPSKPKAKLTRKQWALGCGLPVAVTLCACIGLVSLVNGGGGPSGGTGAASQPTATSAQVAEQLPTHTPRPTATSVPTATATDIPPTPTDTPIPQPQPPVSAQLFVHFTCADATDHASGEVCVNTQPGASLSIKVVYSCTGRAASSTSLQGTRTADGAGNYVWTWTPDTVCQGQAATATVTAD